MNTASSSSIRQRKPGYSSAVDEGASSGEQREKYLEAVVEKVPSSMRPYVSKLVPILCVSANFVERATPLVLQAIAKLREWWVLLQPYHPELLLPSVVGLVLCFFGGSYFTLIAAVEAYRMVGYERTLKCLQSLHEDFTAFAQASEEDDLKDQDGNGIADVREISGDQLLTRKAMLFLKTVDPKRVSEAVAGINSGLLAVIATLKLQFAKSITLGSAIAVCVERVADRYALPLVEAALPPDYRKWAQPLMAYTIHGAAISCAWFMQRVLSAFHSAMRGGLMFSRNILFYLHKMNIVHIQHEDTMIDEALGYGVAMLGFLFQITTGFRLPFPLNILCLPFTLLEWFVMWLVGGK